MTVSPMRAAAVLAHLDSTLDGHPYLQTSNQRGVTVEVYDQALALRLANRLDGLAFGRIAGARVAAVWVGTAKGVPVEIIHFDANGAAA